jgi:hypothetical protein
MKCRPGPDGFTIEPENALERSAVDRWRGLTPQASPFGLTDGSLRVEFLEPPAYQPRTPPYQPKPGDRVRPRGGGPGSFEGTVLSVLPDGRFLVAGDDLEWAPQPASNLEPAPERVCAKFDRPFSDRYVVVPAIGQAVRVRMRPDGSTAWNLDGVVESIRIDDLKVRLWVRPHGDWVSVPVDLECVTAAGEHHRWVRITLPGEAKS